MKLDYKILWLEDDETWLKTIKNKIQSYISDKGYNPTIIDKLDFNGTTFYDEAKDSDIILVDYDLSSAFEKNGDALIKDLRDHKIYTNIVFYSSAYPDILSEIVRQNLSGIYYFERSQLEVDVIDSSLFELIDFFLNRDADINSLRGIAMAEVASFDKKIGDIIFHEEHKDAIIAKVREKLCKRSRIQEKDDDHIWKKLLGDKSTMYLDSKTRADFLYSKVLQESCSNCDRNEDCNCYNEFRDKYSSDIIEQRNKLAHHIENADIDELKFRNSLIKFRGLLEKINSCSKINQNS